MTNLSAFELSLAYQPRQKWNGCSSGIMNPPVAIRHKKTVSCDVGHRTFGCHKVAIRVYRHMPEIVFFHVFYINNAQVGIGSVPIGNNVREKRRIVTCVTRIGHGTWRYGNRIHTAEKLRNISIFTAEQNLGFFDHIRVDKIERLAPFCHGDCRAYGKLVEPFYIIIRVEGCPISKNFSFLQGSRFDIAVPW